MLVGGSCWRPLESHVLFHHFQEGMLLHLTVNIQQNASMMCCIILSRDLRQPFHVLPVAATDLECIGPNYGVLGTLSGTHMIPISGELVVNRFVGNLMP